MTFLIAEIGINHQGSLTLATNLIAKAQEVGVDAIKFQYRNLERGMPVGNEIGDEILRQELKINYLNPDSINELRFMARQFGLRVGISFFSSDDIADFESFDSFDFYKVPSSVMKDMGLINELLQFKVPVYISTGTQYESDIEEIFSDILDVEGWIPMHCVSNYPTSTHNSRLAYIDYLKEKWGRPVGYSSHDSNWAVCAVALGKEICALERHITLSKELPGLDHSSSSTPEEFKFLADLCKNAKSMLLGKNSRVPNQGERINRQNLGRSFYARKTYPAGVQISLDEMTYASPQVGLDIYRAKKWSGKHLLRELRFGEALGISHFEAVETLSKEQLQVLKSNGASLPVRFHDYPEIESRFPLNNFEFHLTYSDLQSIPDSLTDYLNPTISYSIHTPDYLNSNTLVDCFSPDKDLRTQSRRIINECIALAREVAEITQNKVSIISSFANVSGQEYFVEKVGDLIQEFSQDEIEILPQWLPPFAWYFGGSVNLHSFNSIADAAHLGSLDLPICLDISHLIMTANFEQIPVEEYIEKLVPITSHIHLSGASGIDGEGGSIAMIREELNTCLAPLLKLPVPKVLEVWQGHTDFYRGFSAELLELWKMIGNR